MALLAPIHLQAVATARRLCRSSADGDDLYQESVLRAFEKLHTLRDESRFRSWFYVTLLSRHRTRCRPSFWRRLLPLEEVLAQGQEPVGEDGTGRADETWRASRVAEALGALAPEQREAVVLFEIDGFSIEEIAVMQKVSISAVKSRLTRGRERLRRHYERRGWHSTPAVRNASAPVRTGRPAGENLETGSLLRLATASTPRLFVEERSHE